MQAAHSSLAGRSLLSAKDLDYATICRLLCAAEHMRRRVESGTIIRQLAGKIIGRTIFEASTRTDQSFDVATKRLGGQAAGGRFYRGTGSSLEKGESDEDTFRTIAGYSDLVVVRHSGPKDDEPDFVKQFCPSACNIPIVNAGNGIDEHPTQTLLDWYCIARESGCLDDLSNPDFERLRGLNIALCGDLKYGRTVTGNMIFAKQFGARVILASPPTLAYDKELPIKPLCVTESLSEALKHADILYMTRVQRERFSSEEEYKAVAGAFLLNRALYERIYPNPSDGPLILHPMPRYMEEGPEKCELNPDLDTLKNAAYFRQSQGGMYTRMALLAHLLGVEQRI